VLGLALDAGGDHGIPGLFTLIETIEADALRLHLLGRWNAHVLRMVSADTIEAAAAGDAKAQRSLRRASYPDEAPWQKAMRHVLRTEPEHVRDELLHILRLWHDKAFAPDQDRLMPILEREAVAIRRDAVRRDGLGILDHVTDGLRWAIGGS